MGMIVAGVAMGMEMRHIIVLMNMAMDKIMSFQESEVFQDLFRVPIPYLSLVFPHHHQSFCDLRNDVNILGGCDNRASLITKLTYGVYEMPASPGIETRSRLI